MKRAAVATGLLLTILLLPASPAAAVRPAGTALRSSSCVWKWQTKRVVRWVRITRGRRKGQRRRTVTTRRVRICVPVPPPPAPARLGVKAREFHFTLSTRDLRAGDTIVELVNQGEDDHNLHLQRVQGGEARSTEDLPPGGVERLRLNTQPGTYRLWCSLPYHAEAGMDTTVTVTSGG